MTLHNLYLIFQATEIHKPVTSVNYLRIFYKSMSNSSLTYNSILQNAKKYIQQDAYGPFDNLALLYGESHDS